MSEFGLMGLKMSLAVEKAQTLQELIDIKERVLGRIRNEHGAAAFRIAERNMAGKPKLRADFAPTETHAVEEPSPTKLRRPLEASELSAALTRIISHEFGIRGIWLTLALERAESLDDLRRVAKEVIGRVERESGLQQAADVAEELEGIEIEAPIAAAAEEEVFSQ